MIEEEKKKPKKDQTVFFKKERSKTQTLDTARLFVMYTFIYMYTSYIHVYKNDIDYLTIFYPFMLNLLILSSLPLTNKKNILNLPTAV